MKTVIVIGGGPAGMIAAGISASKGNKVILLEKNNKLGKKLNITGKGRCNITNISTPDEILENIITNKRFMYSSLNAFNNYDVINFFEENGVPIKVERGNRVFPISDSAADVVQCLKNFMKQHKVNIKCNKEVKNVLVIEGDNGTQKFKGVTCTDGTEYLGDSVIITTGGKSYPGTGSTGDGYKFAKALGHKIMDIKPGLVPLVIRDEWIKTLQGLSLKNVEIKVMKNDQLIYSNFGEMLFTHYGVSGPIILSASSHINKHMGEKLNLILDLKPALSKKELDQRLLRDFKKYINKDFRNSLDDLLPKKMIPIVVQLSKIDPFKKVNEISKLEREQIVKTLKEMKLTISGFRNIKEAIITSGGVDVRDINPKTMASKIIDDVYFAGEVLDIDALTGGYNLQVAFSTGYIAGQNA